VKIQRQSTLPILPALLPLMTLTASRLRRHNSNSLLATNTNSQIPLRQERRTCGRLYCKFRECIHTGCNVSDRAQTSTPPLHAGFTFLPKGYRNGSVRTV
jgi:hypothetical protein